LTSPTRDVVDGLAPPYLVIAHHVSSFDPFLISAAIGKPVQYLASDAIFRNPLLKMILSLVGAIPKAKFRSDRNVIRNLLAIRDRGGLIGVFPEGQSSWDGVNQPFLLSTGKLVKLLKIPVVSAKVHGAYHIRPRWSRTKRFGSVEIEFTRLISKEELSTLDADGINGKIAASLEYSVWDRQRRVNQAFRGKRVAEGLEKALFVCPECLSVGTLRSRDDRFGCGSCGMSVRVNDRGFFELPGEDRRGEGKAKPAGAPRFADIREWNLWQTERLKTLLGVWLEDGEAPAPLEDRNVVVTAGERSRALRRVGKGTLSLDKEGLAFVAPGTNRVFGFRDLGGLNVQPKERMEFFYGGELWRFEFPKIVSAYKWYIALNYVRFRLGYAERGIFYGDALATGV